MSNAILDHAAALIEHGCWDDARDLTDWTEAAWAEAVERATGARPAMKRGNGTDG